MKSTLRKIYEGEAGYENIAFSEDWQSAREKALRASEKIRTVLTKEQLKVLEEYANAHAEVNSEELRSFYAAGFKTGFGLAYELIGEIKA